MKKLSWLVLLSCSTILYSALPLQHDAVKKQLLVTDQAQSLKLLISYDRGCLVQQIFLKNEPLLGSEGLSSRVQEAATVLDSRSLTSSPAIRIDGAKAIIGPFRLGPVEETWELASFNSRISFTVKRNYATAGHYLDSAIPLFHFKRMDDWDGALLANGGVAWFKLFDTQLSTYGVHVDKITLWNQQKNIALRIQAHTPEQTAVRFSRQPDQSLLCSFSVSREPRICKYDSTTHRRRFLTDRQDVWDAFDAPAGLVTVQYDLQALNYQDEYGRGRLNGLDEEAINALLNTVARLGVIDTHLHGSNSWRTPYGPAVLHEQWIALLASAICDDDYVKAYQSTLSFYRDHAIEKNGRVKSRWAYTCEDAIPGTCDSLGFYEAQWGYLLDSNPDFVINVAELFDLSADSTWLHSCKSACERALQFMLARDQDADHLVEMMTSDHQQARGSDWIDIIWAAHENGFINALMYRALTLWADAEEVLHDPQRAAEYRRYAQNLKTSFNLPTSAGGLWDVERQCYIHWRDADHSIHGRNMVIPVNFMAIAYGLCDDPVRQKAILQQIEGQTQKENLFAWPICLYSYEKGEGLDWQFPFPNYENGDIFLGWGQVGVAAYAAQDPAIAVKYVEKLLAQYRRDGLAFQRYLRKTQIGAGDDILANNAMTLVGLYRDIYGIQPRHNRLYLEPHVTPQLNGTQVIYRHRGHRYIIDLSMNDYRISGPGCSVHASQPFGINTEPEKVEYFNGAESVPCMQLVTVGQGTVELDVLQWQSGHRMTWTEMAISGEPQLQHTLLRLLPNSEYLIMKNGTRWKNVKSNNQGEILFTCSARTRTTISISKTTGL